MKGTRLLWMMGLIIGMTGYSWGVQAADLPPPSRQVLSNQFTKDKVAATDINGQLSIAKAEMAVRQQENNDAKQRFLMKQKLQSDDPTISTEKERAAFIASYQALKNAQNKTKRLTLQLKSKQAKVAMDQAQLSAMNRKQKALREKNLRQEIEKIQTVHARGESGCSENMSIGQCKDAALTDAKRRAAEQAVSMIESDTQVKDFVVQSDRVRSRLHAIVKNVKVLKHGFVGGGVGYFYEIEASVQGQYVPDESTTLTMDTQNGAPVAPLLNSSAFALTVKRTPSYAKVSIQNIKPRYHDGILLEPGRYKVRVKATGYKTFHRWIELSDRDKTLKVTLIRQQAVDRIPARRQSAHRQSARISRKKCGSKGQRYLDKAAVTFNHRKKMGYLKLALQYCPQSPMVDVAVGEALMEHKPSGYLPRAQHMFERALRLDPQNISAKEGLQDVKQRKTSQAQTQKMMGNIIGAFFR